MKRKTFCLALIFVFIITALFVSGCGDTSRLAGNASIASEDTHYDDTDETSDSRTVTVVLNTNKDRKRIHIPGTSCAESIHEEHYLEWTGTEEELKDFARKNGYVACGRCHPDQKLNIDLPKNK